MATIKAQDFTVNTKNLRDTRFTGKIYTSDLAPNQVLLAIDRFSFTSNNITYGVVGERMNYWKFFPAEDGHGIIPVWGFANVQASNHPEVSVGQRFYGYYPMSSHLLVTADKVSAMGFVDATEHRQSLPAIYNFYTNTDQDPSHSPEAEDLICLFRPLFVTSFLIDDYLAGEHFHNASQILITSASSKTAQALAFLLAARKKNEGLNLKLKGLTSARNSSFVSQLGWYDEVIDYDALEEMERGAKVVVVDFAGNHDTQYRLQMHLGDQLCYNCRVGLVDWQNLKGEKPLPSQGEFFFAPTHAQKRQKDWGIAGFQQKVGLAWQQFTTTIQSSISIKATKGSVNVKQLYLDMLSGNIDPKQGNVASLIE